MSTATKGAPAWPADRTERWPIERLTPYAHNARTHSEAQVAQIAASMQQWGWTNPVLVDEAGTVIAGHGRLRAAQGLGWTEAPVMVATGWTEAQRRAYALADNKLALNADWDIGVLAEELRALDTGELDLSLIGFGADELEALLTWSPGENGGLTDPDEVPAVPEKPVSQIGDLWLLGPHRLVCGDSTKADDVAKALNGVAPHLMVTDPPYGVDYDPKWRLDSGLNKAHQKRAEGKVKNDDRADWREAWALFPGEVVYVWHGGLHAAMVAESLAAAGFEVRSQIIWAKPSLVIGRGHYHWQHEPCWYAVRKSATGHWAGDRKQSTLWQIQNMHRTQGNVDDGKTSHGAQKPVECMKRPIENNSSAGQAVYEPFSGSGTTIIAAQMTGRVCHALEIDPGYCDVAVQRWQAFTGKAATLEGEGHSFAEVTETRQP